MLVTLSSMWPREIAHIGQLADVARHRRGDYGRMEILMSLDRVEPPAGRIRVMPGPAGRGASHEVRFAGWLGMLRALYEVTGAAATGQRGGR